jgi:hypothetical protein
MGPAGVLQAGNATAPSGLIRTGHRRIGGRHETHRCRSRGCVASCLDAFGLCHCPAGRMVRGRLAPPSLRLSSSPLPWLVTVSLQGMRSDWESVFVVTPA